MRIGLYFGLAVSTLLLGMGLVFYLAALANAGNAGTFFRRDLPLAIIIFVAFVAVVIYLSIQGWPRAALSLAWALPGLLFVGTPVVGGIVVLIRHLRG